MIDFTKYDHWISTMPLLQQLCLTEIQYIQSDIIEEALSAGQRIYQAEDLLESLDFIQEGKVKDYRLDYSDKEQVIRILEQDDHEYDFALFEEQHYGCFIEAISPTKVCSIQKDNLKRILLSYPQIDLEL
ncbi:Crp/Fnr family transcriptional regulator [Enterococcus faecium]|uniref:Crp/Fnr family transcriptional regulator n=1 Tax=Enterococcus faecium TaxID=1352 RepID=UPI001FD7B5A6|nr:cyclic nucleotide-binding domain-containing protein [Enterococcus faecium]